VSKAEEDLGKQIWTTAIPGCNHQDMRLSAAILLLEGTGRSMRNASHIRH